MNYAIYYLPADQYHDDQLPAKCTAITIDPAQPVDKTALLRALGEACRFPTYFALNWDSAFDCLTDSAVTYLCIDLSTAPYINHDDWRMFCAIISDAYHDFGKPLLFVKTAPLIQPHSPRPF